MANIETIRLEGRFSLTYRGQTLYPDPGSTWLVKPEMDETALRTAVPPETKTIVEKRIWSDGEGFIVESATLGASGLAFGARGVDLENLHSEAITPRIALGRTSWKLVPESVTYNIPAALVGTDDNVVVQDAIQASELVLTPGQVNDLAFVRTLRVGRGELVVGIPGPPGEPSTVPGPPGPAGGTFIAIDPATGKPYFNPVGVVTGRALRVDTATGKPYFEAGA